MATKNSKSVARSNGGSVGGWATTGQIMHDASRQYQKLGQAKTKLDVDKIKAACTLLRIGVSIAGLQLQYQRQTGTPKKQRVTIPSFPIK